MRPAHDTEAVAVCNVAGCGRLAPEGSSRCCSSCGTGIHSRRCDRRVRQSIRMNISSCFTQGCLSLVSKGHTHCCSTCRSTGGESRKRAALGDKVLSVAVMRPTAEAARVAVAVEMAIAVEVGMLELALLLFSWTRWISKRRLAS